ncbi:hypothetical protein HN011_001906 [Eciton burchellii]|nr:hypothetical protein HN011_001906 [Eciton burchellii]
MPFYGPADAHNATWYLVMTVPARGKTEASSSSSSSSSRTAVVGSNSAPRRFTLFIRRIGIYALDDTTRGGRSRGVAPEMPERQSLPESSATGCAFELNSLTLEGKREREIEEENWKLCDKSRMHVLPLSSIRSSTLSLFI